MRHYAVVLAMFGFVASNGLSLYGDVPLGEALVAAMFWALIFGLCGVVIGWVAQRVIGEIDLPSEQEEVDGLRYDERIRRFQSDSQDAAVFSGTGSKEE